MIWCQIAANGFAASASYVLVALSFMPVFRVARFFHFAHAISITLGPYLTFSVMSCLRLSLLPAACIAVPLCGLIGAGLEVLLFAPLRRKNTTSEILLLVSLGIYVVMQNFVSLIFGDATRSLLAGAVPRTSSFLGVRITEVQWLTIAAAIAVGFLMMLLLGKTKHGRALRAVADEPDLSELSGVNAAKVLCTTFAACSALGGLAGILIALDVNMRPTMGLPALMMGVIVAIVGGMKTVWGIVFGAVLVGMTQHLGAWKTGAQWQDAIAFAILLLFLLFRPQGFFRRPIKTAEV